MKHRIILLSIGLATLVFAPSLKAQERMRPGNWEVVIMGDNPHTSTTCFTSAMMKGINGTAAEVRADTDKIAVQRKYKVENYKFDGTTMSFTAVGAEVTFINTASYHGDTYESTIVTKKDGKETTMRQKGRRVGSCP
jgi:hypothetical protein